VDRGEGVEKGVNASTGEGLGERLDMQGDSRIPGGVGAQGSVSWATLVQGLMGVSGSEVK